MRCESVDVARRTFPLRIAALAAGLSGSVRVRAAASRQRLQVGPQRAIKTVAEASRIAAAGAVIEIDAGDYVGDVATWTLDGVGLRAVGGRVRLIANGAAAEGKAIWVVRARGIAVEGFDFEGAAVASRNGAGIRLEAGSLRVRDCSFVRNEMGLLTNNDPETELDIENSEFAHNHRPDGHNHNLYAGTIRRLTVTGSYFHHGYFGHLLKSRAAINYIAYNRLTDEAGGSASYELEFPNGGLAYVIGNIIQQGPLTENPHLVSYGAEGYRWPVNEIHLVHNTLVDDRAEPGMFLRVQPGDTIVRIVNNLLVGRERWDVGPDATMQANARLNRDDIGTSATDSYRPKAGTAAAMRPVASGSVHGLSLTPDREYLHPRRTRALRAPPSIAGALQPDISASR
jgi:hypothetical protein